GVLRDVLRQGMLQRKEAAGLRLALLVTDVHLARRVFADDDDGEAGTDAAALLQGGCLLADRCRKLGGPGLAVYHRRAAHSSLLLPPAWCGSQATRTMGNCTRLSSPRTVPEIS